MGSQEADFMRVPISCETSIKGNTMHYKPVLGSWTIRSKLFLLLMVVLLPAINDGEKVGQNGR